MVSGSDAAAAMAQTVISLPPLPHLLRLVSIPEQSMGIYGRQSSPGGGFSQNTSVIPSHYHSTNAP